MDCWIEFSYGWSLCLRSSLSCLDIVRSGVFLVLIMELSVGLIPSTNYDLTTMICS
jgi:hypothetical protein